MKVLILKSENIRERSYYILLECSKLDSLLRGNSRSTQYHTYTEDALFFNGREGNPPIFYTVVVMKTEIKDYLREVRPLDKQLTSIEDHIEVIGATLDAWHSVCKDWPFKTLIKDRLSSYLIELI